MVQHNEKMNDLITKAIHMTKKARAPYSKYNVGAAIKVDEGKIIGGCNIENASYPLSICAERTALFSAIAQGYKNIDFSCIFIVCDTKIFFYVNNN